MTNSFLSSFLDPDKFHNVSRPVKPLSLGEQEKGGKTKSKTAQEVLPAQKSDDLDKKYKIMEDISITKAIPKEAASASEEGDEPANRTTTVKLVVAGDQVTAKPVPSRPKVKQGLIPGEGKRSEVKNKKILKFY